MCVHRFCYCRILCTMPAIFSLCSSMIYFISQAKKKQKREIIIIIITKKRHKHTLIPTEIKSRMMREDARTLNAECYAAIRLHSHKKKYLYIKIKWFLFFLSVTNQTGAFLLLFGFTYTTYMDLKTYKIKMKK